MFTKYSDSVWLMTTLRGVESELKNVAMFLMKYILISMKYIAR